MFMLCYYVSIHININQLTLNESTYTVYGLLKMMSPFSQTFIHPGKACNEHACYSPCIKLLGVSSFALQSAWDKTNL